jgi:23S rRNA (guanosine2251-2'-O)-methyltransferase
LNEFYIYGRKPILAALKAEANITKIIIQYGITGDEINQINYLARKIKIPITTYDKNKFYTLLKTNNLDKENHQGVVALREIGISLPLFQLIDEAYEKNEFPIILFLDEIQDPHNLGSIARSAESVGAAGLIIPESKSSPITPVAFKTSAGALEYLPYCSVKSVPNTLAYLKERGFWLIGTDMEANHNYFDIDYNFPVVLIIGNEGKGIRHSLVKQCDYVVKIPTLGKTESLNASVSAGIILFEILRKRISKK